MRADALVVAAARGRRAGRRRAGPGWRRRRCRAPGSTLRAPGMTVVTPGLVDDPAQREGGGGHAPWPAISATLPGRGDADVRTGTPAKVSPTSKASPLRLKFRWSSAGNVVDSSYLPAEQPAGQGHAGEDRRPRPRAAAGSSSSRGLRRKTLRMTWIDCHARVLRARSAPPRRSPPRRRRPRSPPRRRARRGCRRPRSSE